MRCTIKREHGTVPAHGHDVPAQGRWVARDEAGNYLDHDKYQNDLIPRLEKEGYSVTKIGE